ncbi:lytic transglycosylase domain-containing protein [Escherichia coli]|nr:lytic transglycosylase domain-containing protein [Escherichia coli]
MISVDMMATCAPNVSPVTLEKIIQVESGGSPLALNINPKWITVKNPDGTTEKKRKYFKKPIAVNSVQDAVTVTYAAMAAGHSVDMGYMQVNSSNLSSLGYSVEDMFDACKNLKAGSRILTAFYSKALPDYPNEQSALRAALSAYNTGDFYKGFINGYLARYGVNGQPVRVQIPTLNPYTAPTAIALFNTSPQQKDNAMNNTKVNASEQNAGDDTGRKSGGLVMASQSPDNAGGAISQTNKPVVSRSQDDAGTPGVQVEHTPDEADALGAFHETALSEKDAWDSNADAGEDNSTAIIRNGRMVSSGTAIANAGQSVTKNGNSNPGSAK